MEIKDKYNTVAPSATAAEGFYSEKRSKFYAFALHVETEEEVKSAVQTWNKQYHDARHVCWACVLGPDGQFTRAADAGEPGGTAGTPILSQIVKNALTDTLVIVVRYFGGVKLGTGPLAVAYRTAAADALEHATVETRFVEEQVVFEFPYVMMNGVMRVVKEMRPRIVSQDFDNTCRITLSIRSSEAAQLRSRLDALAFE